MGTLGGFYLNPHASQYQAGASTVTRHSGCTWTSGANGVNASTGGKTSKTPDQIHSLLTAAEETNSRTPGWSLADLDKALAKIGIAFEVRTGKGWAAVVQALDVEHRYVVLQGDSDRFGNNTCSGAFDGDHAIGVGPAVRMLNGLKQRWIDDPICQTGRWEYEYILRNYAVKFNPSVSFGVFLSAVPKTVPTSPTRYRVAIRGRTTLYSRVNGKPIGAVTKATYTCTSTRPGGVRWYKIVAGKRTGQAFKPNRYTRATIIS